MLKLQAAPTFKAKVGIPVPGAEKHPQITVEFKHMTKAEFDAFKVEDGEADAATLMRICVAWEGVDGEFNRENVERLVQSYPGSAYAIAAAYAKELYGNRLGN